MFGRLGWGLSIILFIVTIVISNVLGLSGILSFIIALLIASAALSIMKFSKDLIQKPVYLKFRSEDYFKNEETKDWIKNDLIPVFYNENPNFFVNSPGEKQTSEKVLKRMNADQIIKMQRGMKEYAESLEKRVYMWQQHLPVVEEICNQKEEFKNDLIKIKEKLDKCINMITEKIDYRGKVIKIDDLEGYIMDYFGFNDNPLSKNNRISLKEKFDLEADDLSEISAAIIELYVKRNKDLKEALLDFYNHYSISF